MHSPGWVDPGHGRRRRARIVGLAIGPVMAYSGTQRVNSETSSRPRPGLLTPEWYSRLSIPHPWNQLAGQCRGRRPTQLGFASTQARQSEGKKRCGRLAAPLSQPQARYSRTRSRTAPIHHAGTPRQSRGVVGCWLLEKRCWRVAASCGGGRANHWHRCGGFMRCCCPAARKEILRQLVHRKERCPRRGRLGATGWQHSVHATLPQSPTRATARKARFFSAQTPRNAIYRSAWSRSHDRQNRLGQRIAANSSILPRHDTADQGRVVQNRARRSACVLVEKRPRREDGLAVQRSRRDFELIEEVPPGERSERRQEVDEREVRDVRRTGGWEACGQAPNRTPQFIKMAG